MSLCDKFAPTRQQTVGSFASTNKDRVIPKKNFPPSVSAEWHVTASETNESRVQASPVWCFFSGG